MDNRLKSVTPSNIDTLTIREVLDLVPSAEGLPNILTRYKIIRMVYEILGFSLSNDALLALLYETGPQLCLATAGGGKTTFAQIKIILEKIWRKSKCYDDSLLSGENILCLVYNRHNINQMNRKQKQLVEKINLATPDNIHLDEKVNSCTMHSFCERWRKKYASKLGVLGFDMLSDTASGILFKNSISTLSSQYPDIKPETVNVDAIKSLYNYKIETLSDFSDLTETDKFYDIGLPIEYLEKLFSVYDRFKQLRRKYDFTDMLFSFYKLIRDNEDVKKDIQSFYGYIVADEVQDFTPIMWEILKLLTDDGTPLLCIGDEDQNIYNFRGANIYNTLNFSSEFNGGSIFLLSRNRRCRKEILDTAKKVISKNTLRFDKSLKGVKDGGFVKYEPYTNTKGQFIKLIKYLEKMPYSELEETVICYREKETSAELIELLADREIPFHILSGYIPYTHELYTHVFHILDLLESPMDPYCHLNLYKILPVTKDAIYKKLSYNPKSHVFERNDNVKHFKNINYGELVNIKGFTDIINILTEISNDIKTKPMNTYFTKLFNLFKRYYWNFKKDMNKNEDFDNLFELRVLSLFSSDLTYKQFYEKFEMRKSLIKRNNDNQIGVAISTFHGLKGLEYDTSFIINLDNEIFPNYELIDSKDYPDAITLNLKEAERRLFYVALTRPRDNLYIFYHQDNPSLYVNELLGDSLGINNDSEFSQDDLKLLNDFNFTEDLEEMLNTDLDFNLEETEEVFNNVENYEDGKILEEPASDTKVAETPTIILGNELKNILQAEEATTDEIKREVGKNMNITTHYKFSRGEDINSRLQRFKKFEGA